MTSAAARKDSDDELMRRVAQGDVDAFDALFLRHRDRVFGLAYRHLGNRSEAEDVTQDTFLRVLSAAGGYREEGVFKTWLLTITSRLCLKKKARHARWRELFVGLLHPSMEDRPGSEKNPGQTLLEEERAKTVREAIGALPPEQRMAVLLARFEELSYEEIAAVMDKSVASITSLLWRGRKSLRTALRTEVEK